MTEKVLVTYASRTGSTIGVAEKISEVLRADGREVSVLPMQNVNNLSLYDALVLGSAIQDRSWLPEAMAFVQENQSVIAQKKTAMFAVCMTLAMKSGEQYRSSIADWVAPARRIIHPVSEAIFAGALDISKIPSFGDRLKFRLSVLFGVWSEGDHRDWDAIEAWAKEFSSVL